MPINGQIVLLLKKMVAAVVSMQGAPGLIVSPAIAMSKLSHSSGVEQKLLIIFFLIKVNNSNYKTFSSQFFFELYLYVDKLNPFY